MCTSKQYKNRVLHQQHRCKTRGKPISFVIYNLSQRFRRIFQSPCIRVREHPSDETLLIYLKVFILLYADDPAILADSADDLQQALNIYADYCEFWRLTLNQQKSKVLIFSKGKLPNYSFELNNSTLEIVKEYKYLGILFSKNNSFLATKKQIAEQVLFVCLFCCFTSQVNSYGHCGTVSSPNHTFSWAGLNKRLTSNSCTYFRM